MKRLLKLFGKEADGNSAGTASVAIYDFETRELRWVAAQALPTGLLQVQVTGIDHPVWVDPAKLKQGGLRHPPFEPEVREVFTQLKLALDEVYPRTIDEWEDGFRRDSDPEREIAIWMHIANVYQAVTSKRPFSLTARHDILKVLLACTTAPREFVLQTVPITAITEDDARATIEAFYVAS